MGFGACNEMAHVSGRLRFLPSWANEALVSPRPWRRMRMLTGVPVVGGMIERGGEEGKSEERGRRGGIMFVLVCNFCTIVLPLSNLLIRRAFLFPYYPDKFSSVSSAGQRVMKQASLICQPRGSDGWAKA